MFKHGYKYRVKSYEELSKEKDITKDVMGTIFKDGNQNPIEGFTEKMDCFKNVFISTFLEKGTEMLIIRNKNTTATITPWMCECLGEIIEPIRKFKIGKSYTVLNWKELLRVKNVFLSTLENGVDKLSNKAIDGNYILKSKMFDDVFGKEIIIEKKDFINPARGTIIFGGWEVSPWMCKEVENKEKTKKEKQYYSLSEAIEELYNNSNLIFVHPISKTKLIKNISGIEVINSKEVIFTEGWEKKQEPVSFQTAIEKGKKFRVEHEILEHKYSKLPPRSNTIIDEYIEKFLRKEYLNLNEIMLALSWRLTPNRLQKVIQEGKWFYE